MLDSKPLSAKLTLHKKEEAERSINFMNQGYIDGRKISVYYDTNNKNND